MSEKLFNKFYKGLKKNAETTISHRFCDELANTIYEGLCNFKPTNLNIDTDCEIYSAGAKYKCIIEAYVNEKPNHQLCYESVRLVCLAYTIGLLKTKIKGFDCVSHSYAFTMESMLTAYYLGSLEMFNCLKQVIEYGLEKGDVYEQIIDTNFLRFVELFLEVEETGKWGIFGGNDSFYLPYFSGKKLSENALIELCEFHLMHTEKTECEAEEDVFYAFSCYPIYPFEVLAYKKLVEKIEGDFRFNLNHKLLKPFIEPNYRKEITDERIRPSIELMEQAIKELNEIIVVTK